MKRKEKPWQNDWCSAREGCALRVGGRARANGLKVERARTAPMPRALKRWAYSVVVELVEKILKQRSKDSP